MDVFTGETDDSYLRKKERFLKEAREFRLPVFFPGRDEKIVVYRGTKTPNIQKGLVVAQGVWQYESLEEALQHLIGQDPNNINWELVLKHASDCIGGRFPDQTLFIPTSTDLNVAKKWQGKGQLIKATLTKSRVIDVSEDLGKERSWSVPTPGEKEILVPVCIPTCSIEIVFS